eukprot:symbB.v1.2.019636.t1/scaffold1616.1/size109294/12
MPLMKLSAGPLLHCLLRAMSQPTAHGKQVSLGTALSEFWPDFSQRGKAASIGDVLQHQAGLAKPFPSDMSIKAFCNETRMEEAIAAAPICHEDEGLCPVWGDVLAAVLKRIVGRKSAQDALSQTLGPMAGEFSYRAPSNCHTALAGRRPQERVTMQSIYEWLEEKVESFDSMAHNTANSRRRWLSETELAVEKPWMTDPMIVNREAMLIGHSCIAGFGLRATAKALCRMFTSDLVPAEMLAKSLEPGRDVKFATVQQWWDSLGAPQRALGGWQLFPFKTKTTEVQGYGFSDGTTGSIVLRLPEVTLAILLSSCSPRTRHIGRSLLDTICSELGFEVGWVSEPPANLTKRPGETAKSMPKEFKNDGKQTDGARRADDLQQELVKVEAKVAKLSEVLDLLLPGASEAICGVPPRTTPTPQRTMAGFWLSDETEGLESLLEALQVPAMMRSMASAARRTLKIDIEGNEVQISSTTSMLGRQLEETLTRFQVGSSFTGEQAMGGAFTAVASWIEDKEPHQPACLHLVKQFASEGIQLDELFQLQADARLALTTTLSSSQHQFEDRKVELHRQEELEMFCAELGEDLILKKQLALPGSIKALPGGSRITGLGPPGAEGPVQEVPSFTDLRKVQLPTTVFLCVEAIRSTTYFCQEGGSEGIGEKSMPSELLESLPPEIRTALAERQEAYQAYQTPSPSSAASPLTVLKAPSSGPKPTPSKSSGLKTFFFTSCGALSWAACSAMGQAAQLTTRGSVYLCRAGASNLCALPSLQRPRGEEYKVFVDRTMGQRLGLRVDKEDGEIFVLEVQDGLVQEWNDSNPDSQVRVGDILLEVNGQSGDTRTMMDLCKACQPLEMKLRREAFSAEAPEVKVGKAQLEEVQEQEEVDGQVETRTDCGGVPPSVEIQEAVSSQGLAKLELPKPVQLDSSAGSRGLRDKRQGTDAPSSSSRLPKTEPKVCGALEDPTVGATFLDPRNRQQQLGIIAFSRLDPDASAMSRLCRAQVLSNAFDLGRGGMALVAPCSRSSSKFRNAEAAYQATSNWPLSVQRFGSYRDQTRGGFANSWRAMLAALEAKFAPNTAVAAALVKSGDAFLLDTSEALELDTEEMPPDWIGLLLMIVRDKLTKNPSWSLYIQGFCDLQSGKPVDSMKAAPWKAWQEAVQDAIAAIQKNSSAQLASLDPFKHAFEIFSDEFGSLSTDAAAGILSFLSYEMSTEVVEKLVVAVDVDCSGTLSFPEYLFLMRKVRERETQRLEEEIQRLIRCGVNDKEDLLTSLLRVLGYVPDQEASKLLDMASHGIHSNFGDLQAVRDAAADANVNLGGVTAPRRNSGQMMATPTTKRVSMEQQELASLRVVTMGSQATVTQKVVTLSEAYRFLEVYRLREGFTKAEFAELQEWFDKYREEEPETDAGAPLISCFDASRAISRMGYSFTHEEHQLMFTEVDIDSSGTVNFSRFLKLVRKYRHKDLDQIRASLLKMGIVGTGASCNDGRQVLKSSMQFLGMNDPTESMNIPRSRTERTPAQKMKDAEDAKYGALRTAVAKRNQLRVIAQHHHGFDAAEVNLLRKRFLEFDSDGSGSIQSTELRALIKEIWPQMCSDPKYRPELIRILREVDTSDDGKVSFDEFLGLSRPFGDAVVSVVFPFQVSFIDNCLFQFYIGSGAILMPEETAAATSSTGGGQSGTSHLPWHLVPSFKPGETDVNEYTRRLEFLANVWPTEHLSQLAPRACLLCEGTAFQKVVRLDPMKLKVQSLDGIKLVVQTLGGVWGQSKTEHKYERFERAIFGTIQKSDETHTSYIARHEVQYEDLLGLGATLEEMRAYILLRNSGLNPEDKKRVIIDAQGNLQYQKVIEAIQLLGSRFFNEVQSGNQKSAGRVKTYDINYIDEPGESEVFEPGETAFYSAEAWEDYALETLAQEGDEDCLVMQQFEDALIESLQGDSEVASCLNTYVEARQRLLEKTKSRGFWNGRMSKGHKGKGKPKGSFGQRFRQPLAQRIMNSSCRICGQRGHWKAECPQNPMRDQSKPSGSVSGNRPAAFAGMTIAEPEVFENDEDHEPPDHAVAFTVQASSVSHPQ